MRLRFAIIAFSSLVGAIAFVACGDTTFVATQNDASTPTDSGSDVTAVEGGGDSDGGLLLPDPCVTSIHTICDSFDKKAVESFWLKNAACAEPKPDTSASVSAPQSLLAFVPSNEACAYLSAVVTPGSQVQCQFDLRIEKATLDQMSLFVVHTHSLEKTIYDVSLALDITASAGSFVVDEESTPADGGAVTSAGSHFPGPTAPISSFTHIVFQIDMALKKGMFSVDGVVHHVGLPQAPSVDSIMSYTMALGIDHGLTALPSPSPMSAHYDNFSCDVLP
ncbi:MAG: hypothetical protein ABI461_16075 [Polyangiaceae bacterium]